MTVLRKMSLVSEFKFPYESPFTPFSERISDGPDRNIRGLSINFFD